MREKGGQERWKTGAPEFQPLGTLCHLSSPSLGLQKLEEFSQEGVLESWVYVTVTVWCRHVPQPYR